MLRRRLQAADPRLTKAFIGCTLFKPKPTLLVNSARASTAKARRLAGGQGSGELDLKEGRIVIERWRREYNEVRPHSSLGYRPPAPAAGSPRPLTLAQPVMVQ